MRGSLTAAAAGGAYVYRAEPVLPGELSVSALRAGMNAMANRARGG